MKLYFSPMTCSLASRIAIYEAGLESQVQFESVDLKTKTLSDGASYLEVSPKGAVVALLLPDGRLLTENLAVLQYLGDLAPQSNLTPPPESFDRYRLQEWLSFIACELHKHVFYPIFNPASPAEVRDFARNQVAPTRLSHVESHLDGRPFLLGSTMSVADCYLVTVLNWVESAGLSLKSYPNLHEYRKHLSKRESVKKAIETDYALYAPLAN